MFGSIIGFIWIKAGFADQNCFSDSGLIRNINISQFVGMKFFLAPFAEAKAFCRVTD